MRSALVRGASWLFIAAVRSWLTRSTSVMSKSIHRSPRAAGARLGARLRYPCGVRALAAVLVLAAAATPATSLGRLADAVAAEIVRVAAGRPVELAPPEDRTGRRTGRDLDAARPGPAGGPRPRSRARAAARRHRRPGPVGTRLVWSARVVEEPAGTLVDVVSVSDAWDPGLLPLIPSPRAGRGRRGRSRSRRHAARRGPRRGPRLRSATSACSCSSTMPSRFTVATASPCGSSRAATCPALSRRCASRAACCSRRRASPPAGR